MTTNCLLGKWYFFGIVIKTKRNGGIRRSDDGACNRHRRRRNELPCRSCGQNGQYSRPRQGGACQYPFRSGKLPDQYRRIRACRRCAIAGLAPETLSKVSAVVGVAGANVGRLWQCASKRALPFADGRVVTDALIALQGALGDSDGVVGAFGTGSVYNARRDGKLHGIGGWGFVVGDQASGARLGRDLLEKSLLAYDGVRPPSALAAKIMADYGDDPERLVEFAHVSKPKDFARYAPLVFDYAAQGDAIAVGIVKDAADGNRAKASTPCFGRSARQSACSAALPRHMNPGFPSGTKRCSPSRKAMSSKAQSTLQSSA